jgi:hypothetical protein
LGSLTFYALDCSFVLEDENLNTETKETQEPDNRPLFLKDARYQGELHNAPYALSVTSPKIEPIDKRMLKANAHEAMQHQANQQIQMLKKQAELLMKQARDIEERLEISHAIYKADINFEPVINGIYHLYQKEDGTQVLSMVAPYEWGKNMPFAQYLQTVRLLGDRTWDVLS